MVKFETHMHTSPASPCGKVTPAQAAQLLWKHGYRGAALTNHFTHGACERYGYVEMFRRLSEDFTLLKREAARMGVTVFFAAELRFSTTPNDYLLYGVTVEEFCKMGRMVDQSPAAFFASKPKHAVLFQAHPFRPNITREDTRILDGIEAYNTHPRHNSRNDLALAWALEAQKPISCGSDAHQSQDFGRGGLYLPRMPRDERDLAAMILAQDFSVFNRDNV